MGEWVGCLCSGGASTAKKWSVLPVSSIALHWLVGGSTALCDMCLTLLLMARFVIAGASGVSSSVGSPPLQVRFPKAGRSPRRRRMVLIPPIMLSAVASRLWPSRGLLQVALVCSGFLPSP